MRYSTYIDRLERKLKKSYDPNSFIAEAGNEFQPTREYQIVDGIKSLVITGESNIQAAIDSFSASCDINNIITRFLNGDTSVINPASGSYGDFTNCPTTYAEMFDRVQKCENIFKSLPVEIKEKFDNSYEKFWSDFGSDYFNGVFNDYNGVSNVSDSLDSVDDLEMKGVNNAE